MNIRQSDSDHTLLKLVESRNHRIDRNLTCVLYGNSCVGERIRANGVHDGVSVNIDEFGPVLAEGTHAYEARRPWRVVHPLVLSGLIHIIYIDFEAGIPITARCVDNFAGDGVPGDEAICESLAND